MQRTHTNTEASAVKVTRKEIKINSIVSAIKCLEKEVGTQGLRVIGIDRGFSPDYYLLSELNHIKNLVEDLK